MTGFGIPVKRFTDALPKTSYHLRAVSLINEKNEPFLFFIPSIVQVASFTDEIV